MKRAAMILTAFGATAFMRASAAQPVDPANLTGGLLVSDLSHNALFLCRDLNADGDAMDNGERTVFFSAANASGLANPTGAVFSIFQNIDGTIFIADGDSDTIYAIRDEDGDGDANDVGEARVFFSGANVAAFPVQTPNGLFVGDDGFLYVVNAGVGTAGDAIYRVRDVDGDGDANDPGEQSLFCDLQTLVAGSSAFSLGILADAIFFIDTRGSAPDAVMRARDANGDGSISADELTVLVDSTNTVGAPIGFGLIVTGAADDPGVYVCDATSSINPQRLAGLHDSDMSGTINNADEVEVIWDESLVTSPFVLGTVFDFALGPNNSGVVLSSGADEADTIFHFLDLNGDEDYDDAGETVAWVTGGGDGAFPDTLRAGRFILPGGCRADFDGDGFVTGLDFDAFVAAFEAGDASSDFNADGFVNGLDFDEYVVAFEEGC